MDVRSGAALLLAMGAALLSGCGSGGEATYPVTGKVTFSDGTPLANARLTFESTEKRISATGTTNSEGVYRMTTYQPNDGVIAGNHRVLVIPPAASVLYDESEKVVGESPGQPIHPRFQKFETSGLSYTAEKKSGTYDIVVEQP